MDTEEGDDDNPLSLHKYLYASASPVNRIDPSGNDDFDMASLGVSESMSETLDSMAELQPSHFSGRLGIGIEPPKSTAWCLVPHVWPTVGQTWDAADFLLHGQPPPRLQFRVCESCGPRLTIPSPGDIIPQDGP